MSRLKTYQHKVTITFTNQAINLQKSSEKVDKLLTPFLQRLETYDIIASAKRDSKEYEDD